MSKIVLEIALPAIAIKGFMSSLTMQKLKEQAWILLISFLFYFILSIVSWLWIKCDWKLPVFIKKSNSKSIVNTLARTSNGDIPRERVLTMWMLLIFGSTTTFGLPIITEFYRGTINEATSILSVSIFNVPQRMFLYTYCFMMFTGLKFNKKNMGNTLKKLATNTTLLITFIGLALWLTQLIPAIGEHSQAVSKTLNLANNESVLTVKKASYGVNFLPIYFDAEGNKYIYNIAKSIYERTTLTASGWMDAGVTMPYFKNIANMLASLCTPLVWLTVGMKMSESKLRAVFTDKWVWFYTIVKIVIIPLLMLGVMYSLYNSNHKVGAVAALSIVVVSATPPGAVPAAIALSYNKAPTFTARASALSTLASIVFLPIWIILCQLLFT
ncbi:AEC family transporter [Mycoplasma sp. CSL7475-4]|uniref:AEC family transporter n=1 Tax=Mycoplasma sp. CSL7475-4 TaxID=2973942 RepID=UPI00216B5033|nr:AEC family transporter [Mycoplasma sp. CSL7475-4]MCS4536688.1 AEC family transporter [Mycoplasma sp. CSL7475-4]